MKRKKKWFYKSLFSYLPIFFIVISVLFVIFIAVLGDHTANSTRKANEAISIQVGQSVDNMLMTIDKVVVNHILVGDVHDFYNDNESQFLIYSMNQIMNSMLLGFPEIDSFYLVRYSDDLVLTNNGLRKEKTFEDREFIADRRKNGEIMYWSGKRTYAGDAASPVEVVTLSRRVPLTGVSKGLFVVNVRADAISNLVSHMTASHLNAIDLKDASGAVIYSNAGDRSDSRARDSDYLSQSTLSYSGWIIESGIYKVFSYDFFSGIPFRWAALGLFTIVAGSLLIIFVTLINYRPIESIMGQIHDKLPPLNSGSSAASGLDEMRYISLAIDNLLQNENRYQSMEKESQAILRKQLFLELLEGVQDFDTAECQHELERIGIKTPFRSISVHVAEIDRYADFCSVYSPKDQMLMKYVLLRVVQEIADDQGVNIWTEYIDGSHFGVMVFSDSCEQPQQAEEASLSICRKALHWAAQHLKFTFTVGFGGVTGHAEAVPKLYNIAMEALSYKAVLGGSRIITRRHFPEQARSDIFQYVQLTRNIARNYRLSEENWEDDYLSLMSALRVHLLGKEDIKKVLQYLLSYLDQEMHELSEPIPEYWRESTSPAIRDLLDRFDLLDDFQAGALALLQVGFHTVRSRRECQQHNEIITKMKKYIEINYSNPDLSLNQLSDEFKLNTRHLSKLFKDGFGEKFVDYLVKIRIEKAKQLLLETDESVQNIAAQVGYLHSFSFIRVFKKITGTTPGDFRR